MSQRIDRTYTVLDSVEDETHDRCVDFFLRPDGTFGFEEFRLDVEDQGRWTPVSCYSGQTFETKDEAKAAAMCAVGWLQFMNP